MDFEMLFSGERILQNAIRRKIVLFFPDEFAARSNLIIAKSFRNSGQSKFAENLNNWKFMNNKMKRSLLEKRLNWSSEAKIAHNLQVQVKICFANRIVLRLDSNSFGKWNKHWKQLDFIAITGHEYVH